MTKPLSIVGMVVGAAVVFAAGYYVGAGSSPAPMSMQHTMDSMNMSLQGKTGDDFDRAFLSEMIVHHEGAVDMAEAAKANAKHQEIKDLADAIIQAQTTEIAQMHQWMSAWYGAH